MKKLLSILALMLLLPMGVKANSATTVTVTIECEGTTSKFLGNVVVQSKDKNKTVNIMQGAIGDAYGVVICTDVTCIHYGNMTFESGKAYDVTISECNLPGVRIESHETLKKTSSEQPQIRFRSRETGAIEYRYNTSRFRRLGVGMTSYNKVKQPAESTQIQFRYRFTRNGPVAYLSTHSLSKLQPGHKYFVEVKYFGKQKEAIKIQDEGLVETKR